MRRVFLALAVLAVLLALTRRQREGIINGVNDDIRYFPWFVSFPVGLHPVMHCGGSLVHPRVILTATHCMSKAHVGLPVVISPTSNLALDPEMRRINAIKSFEERAKLLKQPRALKILAKYGQVRRIVRVINLPDLADLSLLLLDAPSTKKPVRLASVAPSPGEKLKVVGYGRTNTYDPMQPNATPRFKRSVQSTRMRVYSTLHFPSVRKTDTCPREFVCTTEKKSSACNGDSGGALLTASGELAGVVKMGSPGCRPLLFKTTTIFMSVAHYRRAIENAIETLTRTAV